MKDIQAWLSDPKRSMKAGVELFNLHAPAEFKSRYGQFFADNVKATPMTLPYNMLVNKLTFIVRNSASKETAAVTTEQSAKVDTNGLPPLPLPTAPKGTVSLDELPEELQTQAQRIKELVPLIARLTAEIANEGLAPEEAKALCDELVGYEEEKKNLWAEIDSFIANTNPDGNPIDKSNTPPTAAELMAQGIELAKQVKLIKEKIKRGKDSAKAAKTEETRTKALERVAAYEAELATVESQLAALQA